MTETDNLVPECREDTLYRHAERIVTREIMLMIEEAAQSSGVELPKETWTILYAMEDHG